VIRVILTSGQCCGGMQKITVLRYTARGATAWRGSAVTLRCVDFTKYIDRVLEIDALNRVARVQRESFWMFSRAGF